MKEDGYSGWWFPPNISANYGQTLDQGTVIITWVTMIGGIVVIGLMLFAVIRYQYRPDRHETGFTSSHYQSLQCASLALINFCLHTIIVFEVLKTNYAFT